MKARLKGSNDEFKEVISLKQNLVELSDAHVYHILRLEFEQEPNTIDHWQDVRERAAIAAIQALDTENMTIDEAAKFAIEIADALVKKLKGE